MNAEHRTSNVEHSTTSKSQFDTLGNQLLVRAVGKINLSLLVAGKREDGYHNIETVMAKINWFDEILIEKQTEDGGRKNAQYPTPNVKCPSETSIELICKGEYKVPEGEDNLVYKAAELILDSAGQPTPPKQPLRLRRPEAPPYDNENQDTAIRITLTKNMPAGSGLGSGSSDAAATLMGINKFLKLGLSRRELMGLAAKLGSDVAFFLDGPLAFCTGKGEKVKKISKVFNFSALLILPNVSVSTKKVYAHYVHDQALYEKLHGEIDAHIEKNRIDLLSGMCANMLSKSCFELHNEIVELKGKIERLGIGPLCLSGSGSAMFCIINNDNEEGVRKYQHKLQHDFGCGSIIVSNNSW
jgi:4-diphosphocytidyl-2-C-methyl-D-erythritol kinase